MFQDINKPAPLEIKDWMNEINFSVNQASNALGISKRQLSRFLSGDTEAKKVHALAMQMIWLLHENQKEEKSKIVSDEKKIKIPIK